MTKTKILIADDHRLFLDGIVALLMTEKDFEIGATVTNGNEVLKQLSKNEYDICVLDINMPSLNGIETARQIKEKGYQTNIIILTTYNDKEIISEMLLIGIDGYVLKNSTKSELVKAIKDVRNGAKYYSEEVHDRIMSTYIEKIKTEKDSASGRKSILTNRETEIVKLLAKEYTNENIASTLHISYRTVETHRKNIMQKTKAKNLAGLIKFAYERNILK